MRKSIAIIIVLVLAAVGFGAYLLFRTGSDSTNESGDSDQSGALLGTANPPEFLYQQDQSGQLTPPDYIGPVSQIYQNPPVGDVIYINTSLGTVPVKNFYLPGSQVVEGGNIVFKQGGGYWFTYDPVDDGFWIAINDVSFEAKRQIAEQDFLITLGINRADACKLNVLVGAPYNPQNSLNNKLTSISFCLPGVSK